MPLLTLQHDSKHYAVQHGDIFDQLNGGIAAATVQLYESIPTLRRGDRVIVSGSSWSRSLVVNHFRHAELQLTDIVHTWPSINGYSRSGNPVPTWADVLAQFVTLVKPELLHSTSWPTILIDGVSLADVLTHVTRLDADWGWAIAGDRVAIGPLPNSAKSITVDSHWATDRGHELLVRGELPALGTPVNVSKAIEGRLLSYRFRIGADGREEIMAVVGPMPKPSVHQPLNPMTWIAGTVRTLAPLTVAATINGREHVIQANRLDLQGKKGKSRRSMPLETNDPVRIVWPKGIFCGLPEIMPFAISQVVSQFELIAPEAMVRIERTSAHVDRVECHVREVFDFRESMGASS